MVTIPEQGQIEISESLTPITGTVVLDVTPETAKVELDGKPLRTGSGVLRDILIGSHTLKISAEGYGPESISLLLTEGEQVPISVSLKKNVILQSGPKTPQSPSNLQPMTLTIPGTTVSFTMMPVEGGTFQMGYNQKNYCGPIHAVTLDSYWIGETEVTQELWVSVMRSNPSVIKDLNHPVNRVSWEDCKQFIEILNHKLSSQIVGKRFCLPTEAQWEFACRGGNNPKKYRYSGSDKIEDVAWYRGNSDLHLHQVKAANKNPNQLGLYDMTGNVDEWCEDWFDVNFYSKSAAMQRNPINVAPERFRVVRGGNYNSQPEYCHSCYRTSVDPSIRFGDLGFRLVLTIE